MGLTEAMDSRIRRDKVLDYLIKERIIAQTTKVADADVENKIAEVMRSNQLTAIPGRLSAHQGLQPDGLQLPDAREPAKAGAAGP